MPPEQNTPPAGVASSANPPAGTNPPAHSQNQAVDVNAAIAKAFADKAAADAIEFEKATGFKSLQEFTEAKLKAEGKTQELLTAKETELNQVKSRLEQTAIQNSLLAASANAIDPEIITALLSSKASVDANGNVLVNGKSANDAVAELLKDKPHLAKASGNSGSGASSTAQNSAKQLNRAEFEKLSPAERATFIKASGVVI